MHALGLEHTFDDSDGDFYLSTDPQLSATPSETVMSYRPPADGVYPSDLRTADYSALVDIWGSASSLSSTPSQIIYRLFDHINQKHLYSSNLTEIDLLTGAFSDNRFLNEGIAYAVSPGADTDLYRFYNYQSDSHFYTANPYEKDLLLIILRRNIFSKVAFLFFQPVYSVEIARYTLFYPDTNLPFIQLILKNKRYFPPTFLINEGVAWYV